MIVPDLNLIVYAHNSASPFNSKAKDWWEAIVTGTEYVAVPWVVTMGFLRLMTSPSMANPALTMNFALDIVNEWYTFPAIRPIEPGSNHLRLVSDLLLQVQVGGKLVTDAHIAAVAIEHRAVLHTHDRDFERFSGLRLHDPL